MFLLNGEIFISPNHDVKNINLINESSSKRGFSLNHILRGRVEHIISLYFIFCSILPFRVLLLSKFNILIESKQ
jgi:hypothetical protein